MQYIAIKAMQHQIEGEDVQKIVVKPDSAGWPILEIWRRGHDTPDLYATVSYVENSNEGFSLN